MDGTPAVEEREESEQDASRHPNATQSAQGRKGKNGAVTVSGITPDLRPECNPIGRKEQPCGVNAPGGLARPHASMAFAPVDAFAEDAPRQVSNPCSRFVDRTD